MHCKSSALLIFFVFWFLLWCSTRPVQIKSPSCGPVNLLICFLGRMGLEDPTSLLKILNLRSVDRDSYYKEAIGTRDYLTLKSSRDQQQEPKKMSRDQQCWLVSQKCLGAAAAGCINWSCWPSSTNPCVWWRPEDRGGLEPQSYNT